MILQARYIVPVESPVIENGAVTIERGRIISVGSSRGISHRGVVDYGDAVICPGFVNAHTHLELSHLAGRVPPSRDFVGWLGRLIEAMEADPLRPPWREGLPAPIEASLEPYLERLEAAHDPATDEHELTRISRQGYTIRGD